MSETQDNQTFGSADRPPTAEEEEAAERGSAQVDPESAEHYEEMAKLGAEAQGEGQI